MNAYSEADSQILARIRAAWVDTDDADVRLAELDMPPERFREIIEGARRPSSLDLALLATAFRVTVEWLIDYQPDHVPIMIYNRNDPERIAPPSEVCEACSDIDAGRLVPASFCERAKAQLEPRL